MEVLSSGTWALERRNVRIRERFAQERKILGGIFVLRNDKSVKIYKPFETDRASG